MAGDWIKIQHVTPDKPEVWQMAASLGIDADAVVGKLVRVWVWADQQSVDGTCHAASVTKALLDRMVSVAGFCDCMIEAGWMLESDDGITFTNFDRHNGTSAKKRAQANDRQTASRKRNANVTQGALQKRDQRREEKSNNIIESASADSCPQPAQQTASPQRKHPAWLICQDEADAYCGFQTNGKVKQWLLPYSKIDEWRQAFPGVHIEMEINKARQWLIDNPTRRKTASGMLKFLNTWLTREQNSGRGSTQETGSRAERRERGNAAAFAAVFGTDCEAAADSPGTGQVVQRKIGNGVDPARTTDMGGSTGDVSP